jgi:hypothetical protein
VAWSCASFVSAWYLDATLVPTAIADSSVWEKVVDIPASTAGFFLCGNWVDDYDFLIP